MEYTGRIFCTKILNGKLFVLATGEPDDFDRFPGVVVDIRNMPSRLRVGYYSKDWTVKEFELSPTDVTLYAWKLNGIGPGPEADTATKHRIELKKPVDKVNRLLYTAIFLCSASMVLHLVQVITAIVRSCR